MVCTNWICNKTFPGSLILPFAGVLKRKKIPNIICNKRARHQVATTCQGLFVCVIFGSRKTMIKLVLGNIEDFRTGICCNSLFLCSRSTRAQNLLDFTHQSIIFRFSSQVDEVLHDVVRMWPRYMVRMWPWCGSDVAPVWFGCSCYVDRQVQSENYFPKIRYLWFWLLNGAGGYMYSSSCTWSLYTADVTIILVLAEAGFDLFPHTYCKSSTCPHTKQLFL